MKIRLNASQPRKKNHESKDEKKVGNGCLKNGKNVDNVVSNKRPPEQKPFPTKSKKRYAAKQARLDSFFRVNSDKALSSPLRTQTNEGYTDSSTSSTYLGENCVGKSNTTAAFEKTLIASDGQSSSSGKILVPASPHGVSSKFKNECKVDHSGSLVSFRRLCETLQEMTDTTKRLAKLAALETFIREIIHSDTNPNLTSNQSRINDVSNRAKTLSSALELVLGGCTSAPLNISGSAVSKALQTSLGITRNQITRAYRQYGDVGDCAASFFQRKTHFVIASNSSRPIHPSGHRWLTQNH